VVQRTFNNIDISFEDQNTEMVTLNKYYSRIASEERKTERGLNILWKTLITHFLQSQSGSLEFP